MKEQLEKIKQEALAAIQDAKDILNLEELENRLLGRKSGELTNLMKGLKDLGAEVRKEVGQMANEVKTVIDEALSEKKQEMKKAEWVGALDKERVDVTQPALPIEERGHLHPLTQVQSDLENMFVSMGFMVLDGPELESDYYNFEAMNIPKTHPARDMQDTFYIKGHGMNSDNPWVMHTHTSSVQVRAMQKYGAPIRAVVPGRCFRNESTDARHEHTFYQLEGLVLDKGITFAHLKGTLEAVANQLYGHGTKVNLRPKYYPFVEPGVNIEVTCFLCKGQGCKVCKGSGWLEVGGAGMVHPNVLKEGEIDFKVYQGFAFGFGLDRLMMLKYGVDDVRLINSGDLRFLKQF